MVNGLAEAQGGLEQARLGILPLGTVNVFARELGIPLSLDQAWRIIENGRTRAVDLPAAVQLESKCPRERRFVQMAGVGLDARAVAGVDFSLKKKTGALAYLVSGLKAFHRQPCITAKWANGIVHGQWMCVSNGQFYGGPLSLFPQARFDDGLLDLCVFPRVTPGLVLEAAMAMAMNRMETWHGARHLRLSELSIEGPPGTPVQMDGDPAGALPVSFSILPRALKVLVP